MLHERVSRPRLSGIVTRLEHWTTDETSPRCNVSPSPTDVSPTENSWMLHPLDKVSLGYFAPDRTIPSLNSDLIERSDTRLCRVYVSPTDVSPTDSSWMLQPLNKASLAYYAPDRCVPTLDRATHGSHKAGSTVAIRLPIGYRLN
jgi:hypothetical protein